MEDSRNERRSFGVGAVVIVGLVAFLAGSAFGGMFLGQRAQEPKLLPRSSGSPETSSALSLGETATSPLGNTITALDWLPSAKVEGRTYARTEVEWCAGTGQSGLVSEVVALWSLEMDDSSLVAAYPAPADQSSLAASGSVQLGAGECARGFIDFEVLPNMSPVYVVFSGQESYRWSLEA